MEARTQRTPALLAAAAAIVLVLSMFLNWYALDLPEQVGGQQVDIPAYNAFEGLKRSDVALVVAAVLALAFAAALLARVLASSPLPGLALLGAGVFALAVVLYRGTSRPTRPFFGGGEADTTLEFGWYVGLVAAGLIALGGLLAYLAGPRLQLEDDEFDEEEEEEEVSRPRSEEGK
jgi:energy-coupling factor transporter transmembrane protein EcfT